MKNTKNKQKENLSVQAKPKANPLNESRESRSMNLPAMTSSFHNICGKLPVRVKVISWCDQLMLTNSLEMFFVA